MALSPDELVDRRRLKRSAAFWRVFALLAFTAFLIALLGRLGVFEGGPYVARLSVDGLITDDSARDELLADLAADPRAQALIVRLDSPGGTVVGGEALYLSLRRLAEVKPVVAVMGTIATSAAYMVALAADHLLAREGTVTGSIGVIVQTVEVSRLLKDAGVSAEAIKSGPLKDATSPLEPLSDEARAATQVVVDDMYEMFVGLLAERRGFAPDAAQALADGRVFSGRQALAAKLVDAIGGEGEALAWLEQRGIEPGLPVRDVTPKETEEWLAELAGSAKKALYPESLALDGAISVWHPGL